MRQTQTDVLHGISCNIRSAHDLGAMLGVSVIAMRARLRCLRKDGLIAHYGWLANGEALYRLTGAGYTALGKLTEVDNE